MYQAIKRFEADGVGGAVENGTPWSISGSVGFYLEFFRFLKYKGKPIKTMFLMGGNSGFRKKVFDSTRYNEKSVGDDFTFSWQLTQQEKSLLFLPSVSIKHMNKIGLLNVSRYQYKLGMGACSYRHTVSPGIMHLFEKLPILTFFMPFATMLWIGYAVLRKRGIGEFFKFVALLPLLYIANNIWAVGFYRELRNQKTNRRREIGEKH